MRAQTALEYLMVFSFSLLLISILSIQVYDFMYRGKTDIYISDAQKAVNQIAESADIVFVHGPPSKITTQIYIPQNVKEIIIQNRTIIFVLETKSGKNDVFSISKANLSGNISNSPGIHNIKIEASDGYVKIYE